LTHACDIEDFLITRESKVIIRWDKEESNFHSLILDYWKMKIERMSSMFSGITFQQIYYEYNDVSDRLSKVGIRDMDGFIHYEVWHNSSLSRVGRLVT